MRRLLIVIACVAFVGLALAAGSQAPPIASTSELSINTRVAILENRMDRIQATLDDLKGVPSQLASIEEHLRNLDKSGDRNTASITKGVELLFTGLLSVTGTIIVMKLREGDDD